MTNCYKLLQIVVEVNIICLLLLHNVGIINTLNVIAILISIGHNVCDRSIVHLDNRNRYKENEIKLNIFSFTCLCYLCCTDMFCLQVNYTAKSSLMETH